jgi:hypothetical protein
MACFENATFAVVQYVKRGDQCVVLVLLSSCSTTIASGEGD